MATEEVCPDCGGIKTHPQYTSSQAVQQTESYISRNPEWTSQLDSELGHRRPKRLTRDEPPKSSKPSEAHQPRKRPTRAERRLMTHFHPDLRVIRI